MKKMLFSLVFALLFVCGFSQNVDSLAVVRKVDSLIQISVVLTTQSRYDEAVKIIGAAEKLALDKFGKESASYGRVCFSYGRIFLFKPDFSESEKWNLESKSIWEKVVGKENIQYTKILNNLAFLYDLIGNYAKSEQIYLETMALREKILGKEHTDYARIVNNLGRFYIWMGNYEKAEAFLLESKSIREKIQSTENLDYFANLIDLADVYSFIGDYKKSEIFYMESINLQESVLGKEHPYYNRSLKELAILYKTMGDYEKAEQIFLEIKSLWEKAVGKEDPEYAKSLADLAVLYRNKRDYDKAKEAFLEAQSIWEKKDGKYDLENVQNLSELAVWYKEMGEYEKAEQLFLEVKSTWEEVLGKDHAHYPASLNTLAFLYLEMGNYQKAESSFDELAYWGRYQIEKAERYLSEREMSSYLHKFSLNQDQTLSFAQMRVSNSPVPPYRIWQVCYDNTLFHKGFLLYSASKVKHLALADSTSAEKYYMLKSYGHRLSFEYAMPLSERNHARLTELEEKSNALEKELVRTVAGFGEALRQVDWLEVQNNLKPGEAAVEFVHFKYYNRKDKPTDSGSTPPSSSAPVGLPHVWSPSSSKKISNRCSMSAIPNSTLPEATNSAAKRKTARASSSASANPPTSTNSSGSRSTACCMVFKPSISLPLVSCTALTSAPSLSPAAIRCSPIATSWCSWVAHGRSCHGM